MQFKVMTYNIHKGFTVANSRFVLERIREVIRQSGAEIVFLQEVVGENLKHRREIDTWPISSQFEFLADQVWDHYAYGKNAVYDYGHHGNAILSKFPILEWRNTNISTNRFERRGFLFVKLEIPKSPPLNLVCLHLDLLEKGRWQQVISLEKFITTQIPVHEPLIIAGDLNDWSGRVSRHLEKSLNLDEAFCSIQGQYARTFPARLPFLALDRVFVRDLKVVSAETRKDLHRLSDHLPLVVDLAL